MSQLKSSELEEIIKIVISETVKLLEEKQLLKPNSVNDKTAYAKTEALLYNYMGFKRVVEERKQEIEDIRKHGVPRSCAVTEYVQKGGLPHGIVLEEESVEIAVHRIECAIQDTVHAINLIDRCMAALKTDPYYCILEMRYFEGRTQDDIADYLGCSQVTVSKNKGRLVKELSIRLFPNQAIAEMMQ